MTVIELDLPRHLYGGCSKVMGAKEREVVLCGPAGTGKSRACLEKLLYVATSHPNARLAMCRKTRTSLTQSALVLWEKEVLPAFSGVQLRSQEQEYRFANGAIVYVTGMGDAHERERIKSSQFDMIYVQEATELLLDDWELLLTRLRNNVVGYHQLLGDCNPAAPTHWLKLRCDSGKTRLITTRHEDNPALYDHATGEWTEAGRTYIETLEALSGVRRSRLLEGRWAAAEGLVYDAWDPAIHVLDDMTIPAEWRRFRSVDFGYTNPFVCQWWAVDGDGRMYLYRELYKTGMLVEDAAREIARLSAGENIEATVTDHDAEDRRTLERHLECVTTPARKDVRVGIQAVAGRIRNAGDGRPRLFVLRDALVSEDPVLRARRKPCRTIEEMDGYVWDTREGKPPKEVPIQQDDHGMDAMRYAVMYLETPRREVMAW